MESCPVIVSLFVCKQIWVYFLYQILAILFQILTASKALSYYLSQKLHQDTFKVKKTIYFQQIYAAETLIFHE